MRIAVVWGDDAYSDDHVVENAVGEEWGEFCAALADHGHAVTAYPRQHTQPSAARMHRYLVVPARVGPPAPVPPAAVLPYVGQWAAELAQLWSAEPPDIVHSFGWLGGLAAQLAARRHQLTTVQSFHGLAATTSGSNAAKVAGPERARLEPLLIRAANWVTAGSTEELNVLTKMRRNRARTSVLSTGIDVARYARTAAKSAGTAAHRIVQVTPNLQPCNGIDRTIRVLPQLPDCELLVAQTSDTDLDETDRTKLQRMAIELGVDNRVEFAGHVVPEEFPSVFCAADVVACTPRLAPRATSALQAMASGRVVVGTAVGALRDTVIGGVTGLLVSPTKPHELAAALKALQSQRFQRESMGSAGRSRAISRFAWDRISLDALNIYHQASHAKISATA